MFKFTESINRAVDQCLEDGEARIELLDDEKTVIDAEWEPWEQNSKYDVVTIYFVQNGIISFKYQIEETKTE